MVTVGLLVAYPESENLEGCIPGLYPWGSGPKTGSHTTGL
jgi:hypothetical protein